MKRTTHYQNTTVPNQMALLCVSIHDQNHTETIRAGAGRGLIISHSLTTQRPPGRTGTNTMTDKTTDKEPFDVQEMLDTLDELLDTLDRYHEALRVLLEEFKTDEQEQD
jgi:hypothetical protein